MLRPFFSYLLAGCLGLSSLCSVPALAQARTDAVPLQEIPRLPAPVTVDGFSTEPAWQAIDPLPLTVYQPVFGAEPTERTEIRVAHDDTHLYVSGRLYDQDPSAIRINSMYRDRYSGDDGMAIVLDTFNDNENALWFIITPAGVRLDWAVSNDGEAAEGASAVNRDWNTFWDAATQVTDEGWFAEVRIPFSSLGFQAVGDRVSMGLITYRFIARKSERHIFPPIRPGYDLGFAKPSQGHDVVLRGVDAARPVYVAPYVLGGTDRQRATIVDGELETYEDDFTYEAGLDVKYNLTGNLTLDVTANTDFAQVEADEQQVNLSRVSLFFPEKRQFFQERAAVFDFYTGRRDRLFYSRRIGLSEDGQPVRILGGVRLVGRLRDWDVGLIDMQTARTSELDLPTENFGVLRLRRQVLNPFSYLGAIATTRIGGDGSYNIAYGADASLRVVGDDYVTLRVAHTVDDQLRAAGVYDPIQAGMVRAQWERRTQRGLFYQSTFKWYGDDFTPDLGFITRENIYAVTADVGYGWFLRDESPLRTTASAIGWVSTLRNDDHTVETGRLSWSGRAEFKGGAEVEIQADGSYEDLQSPLLLPEDAFIPTGSYTFAGVEARFRASRSRSLLRSNASMGASTFYDGWRFDVGVEPTWNASRHLELSTEYSLNVVRFPDRDQGFDAHIVRLRIQGAVNKRFTANAFVQYSNVSDLVSANLRLRYNFREGNDLWLVYNHGLDAERLRSDLELPATQARSAVFKYTHTFAFN